MPHTHKMIVSNWRNLWRLSAGKKKNFILHVFLEILQRSCKLVVLGTLGIPGHAHPNWYYQLAENFCVYLQVKNQLHPPFFCEDIAKICKHLILGTLDIPGYTHPAWQYQLAEEFVVYLHGKNKLYHSLLFWDTTF